MPIVLAWLAATSLSWTVASASPAVPEKLEGHWRATDTAATRVLGDIYIFSNRIEISQNIFPLTFVRPLDREELDAVGDLSGLRDNPKREGILLSVNIPAATRLVRGFSLCGEKDAHWMILVHSGDKFNPFLHMLLFSGAAPPDAAGLVATNQSLCDDYLYFQGKD